MKAVIGLALGVLVLATAAEAQTVGGGSAGGPGPAANASSLVGCIYRPSGAVLTAGSPQAALACDTSGNLLTTGSGFSPSATVGSAFPAIVTPNAGKNPLTSLTTPQALGTDGGVLPTQGTTATTRTTLTASTATIIDTGHPTRIAVEVQTEVALTAPVFICFTQLTGCSATSYDKLLPIGAAGAVYTPPFAPTGTAYAFTTQTGVILTSASWFAQ